MTSIKEVLQAAIKILQPLHASARIDAEVLLAFALQQNRSYLYTYEDKTLPPLILQQYQQLIQARLHGQPIAYLTGQREFWSLPLKVNSHTLIPRPETELLVETLLSLNMPANAQILDLGTGSGAIALACAKEKPAWEIYACDIDPQALAVAQENATNLKLSQVHFICSDWFDALDAKLRFDAIVANPPYIAESDPHLQKGDLRFEPKIALIAGKNGLSALQYIIKKSFFWLKPNGWLMVEHGYQQKLQIEAIFKNYRYVARNCLKDYQGHDRLSLGKKLAE